MNAHLSHLNLNSLDGEYRFGHPKLYLAVHDLARLMILRSRLGDRHAQRLTHAAASSISLRSGSDLNERDN
jgi:hypothetical protein